MLADIFYLFWITHPTKLLGALFKKEAEIIHNSKFLRELISFLKTKFLTVCINNHVKICHFIASLFNIVFSHTSSIYYIDVKFSPDCTLSLQYTFLY